MQINPCCSDATVKMSGWRRKCLMAVDGELMAVGVQNKHTFHGVKQWG